jgi:hypothetical protein
LFFNHYTAPVQNFMDNLLIITEFLHRKIVSIKINIFKENIC